MNCYKLSISALRTRYKNGQVELEPPYQRKPAWRRKQRLSLLSSLFNGIPIPALIFHKHFDIRTKKDIFDVLDGKQRIETILHFIEERELESEEELFVEFVNPHNNNKEKLFYDQLRKKNINKDYENVLNKFWQYEIPVIEYEGELYDFFGRNVATKEVFVKINSTGSPLKKNEIRHAEWSGPFFALGKKLEKKYSELFTDRWKLASQVDISRYLLHEFILELCTAIHYGNFSDRRKRLDEYVSQHEWKTKEITKIEKQFNRVILWLKAIFPQHSIRYTRFRNKSDFYSLFVVLLNLIDKGYVTLDTKSNKIAGKFLKTFSQRVQELEPRIKPYGKHVNMTQQEQKLLAYVFSIRQATDGIRQRGIRHDYLLSVLKDGFFLKNKDIKRSFSQNAKDLLWSELKSDKPKCPNPRKNINCKKFLTYEDAQVDHKDPWSKGGPTTKDNAQLICSKCNISKGNKNN